MEEVTNDLKLFEEYAKRVRTNIKKFEQTIRSENASDGKPVASDDLPIASDNLPIASDEMATPSDPTPLEEDTKPSEEPPRVDANPLEQKPTVLTDAAPSVIVPIPSNVVSDNLCAKCKRLLKPKRVRKTKTKKQLEAQRTNLAKRWQKDRKKLEDIPEEPAQEKKTTVAEVDDWCPPPAPRRMVGKIQKASPRAVCNPFDSAF